MITSDANFASRVSYKTEVNKSDNRKKKLSYQKVYDSVRKRILPEHFAREASRAVVLIRVAGLAALDLI